MCGTVTVGWQDGNILTVGWQDRLGDGIYKRGMAGRNCVVEYPQSGLAVRKYPNNRLQGLS
jgi:hypothetical protein